MIASNVWYWLWQSRSIVLQGCQQHLEGGSFILFLETEILSFQTACGFKMQINFYKGTGDASVGWLQENILFMYLTCKANMQWCIPFITFNIPCNLSSKTLWWRENISVLPQVLEGAHSCFLEKQDHILCSTLPYVILKSKHVAKKNCPQPLHFQHQKPQDGLVNERISEAWIFKHINFYNNMHME